LDTTFYVSPHHARAQQMDGRFGATATISLYHLTENGGLSLYLVPA
jgi:hypothetical protein